MIVLIDAQDAFDPQADERLPARVAAGWRRDARGRAQRVAIEQALDVARVEPLRHDPSKPSLQASGRRQRRARVEGRSR
jgi:hypothetical protein